MDYYDDLNAEPVRALEGTLRTKAINIISTRAVAAEAEAPEEDLEVEAAIETTKWRMTIFRTEATRSKLEASGTCAIWMTRYHWLEA